MKMSETCCTKENGDQPDACCSRSSEKERPPLCPQCGKRGKRVDIITLEHLLTPTAKRRLGPGPYAFCQTPTCPLVYFTKIEEEPFDTGDLQVPVTQKDLSDSTPVCYCFHHTRRSIQEEIERTGRSTVVASISAEVQAGRCECEIRNPQGACCLGNVSRAVKKAMF